MRRLLLLSTLVALVTVPLALAGGTATDGTLSVKRGKGTIQLRLRGTVIGRVALGRVQVRDFRPSDGNDPQLTCKPKPRKIAPGVYVCQGRNLGYRVNDGRFNVNVRGSGIWISAVGRGPVVVDGAGDTGAGVNDGTMSLDNGPYLSLPDEAATFYLGTPQPVR
jgi:hypothetical protein